MNESQYRRLADADKKYMWHPFTPMKQWLAGEPTIIASGESFELIDAAGRRYIDGFSSLWCNLHGHRVEAIDRAIRDQLGRIAHTTLLGFASEPSIALAERLVKIMPPAMRSLERVFLSDCGASAVEVALKMAWQYWRLRGQDRRRFFIAFREGYHGDTLGAVSVGGIDIFHDAYKPLLFETQFADSPNRFVHPAGDGAAAAVLTQVEKILSSRPGECCAIIIEPLIQAAAGMLTHQSGFLKSLRELADRHDVLLIADEVATGFCRTGTMFACEQEGVCPDLLCLGKGLSGGYLPVSATMATGTIFDAFAGDSGVGGYAGTTFFHGHTFSGNVLGCAAANASIDLIHSSGLLDALPAKVDYMRGRLAKLAGHPHVGDVRQCGMMAGIHLGRNSGTPYKTLGVPSLLEASCRPVESTSIQARPESCMASPNYASPALCAAAMRHGVIIRSLGDVVVLMPAPAMDMATLARLMDAVEATVGEFFE